MNGALKASIMAAGMFVGLLSVIGSPALADSPGDPSWYINCAVHIPGPIYALSNAAPATQAKCNGTSGSINVFAFQLNYAGPTFTVGTSTNAQVFYASTATGTITGTWTLNDVTTSKVISSGSFGGSVVDATNTCSILNEFTPAGTANTGVVVTHGDDVRLTITYTASVGGGTVSICSGGLSPSSTDTQVGVDAAVPQFGVAAVIPAAFALLLVRLLARRSPK